jgi:hypothetical protein
MVRQAPVSARSMAMVLFKVIFSFRKTAARIKMKIVDIWFRIAARDAVVYFIPATQHSNAR